MKPLDAEMLTKAGERTNTIVTIEDNTVIGGLGSLVSAFCNEHRLNLPVLNIGWPDCFAEQGDTNDLFEKYGLSANAVAERISEFIEGKN